MSGGACGHLRGPVLPTALPGGLCSHGGSVLFLNARVPGARLGAQLPEGANADSVAGADMGGPLAQLEELLCADRQ
eukprot:2059544-Lingulodinium_polyedra.AAC.1